MNWLQNTLYGFVSGLTEFLPISSEAHKVLLRKVFGISENTAIQDVLIHIAMLLAVLICCRALIVHLIREQRKAERVRRKRGAVLQTRGQYDMRLLRSATLTMLVGLILGLFRTSSAVSLPLLGVFLTINGIILYIPEHMRHGNKDSRSMSGFDGLLIGLSAALSVFPGISRVGATASIAIVRGADKGHALNWALLISIPALSLLIIYDVLQIISSGIAITLAQVPGYILTALFGYLGAYLSIMLMRFLTVRIGFSGFAYYSLGAALFAFILYLI